MSNKDLFKLSFGQEFEYASFENTTRIAYLKDIKQTVALKSLDFDTEHSFDNIATELITQGSETKTYYMVLQYANSGDLRCYLNPFNNNSKLTPSEKLEIQEEKEIEKSKVEKSFASKGVDRLKMHETVTNNVM
ncbi:2924_t:CDS:2 [Gigaspora margarita]|uniref:2924_t:CDS:1 n=1 Tax=Gigaspora margarita TaxID=4874 RepID=A0ABN7WAK8_GIGMA|nr:2924_t:CDS:2 [Gigaspora margarita]